MDRDSGTVVFPSARIRATAISIPDGHWDVPRDSLRAERERSGLHDLYAFEALPVPEQERVFGRTKASTVRFPHTVRFPLTPGGGACYTAAGAGYGSWP